MSKNYKGKYNLDNLLLYCKENEIELKKDYSLENLSCLSKIEGYCKTEGCINYFEKEYRYFLKSKPFCKNCGCKLGKIKSKNTFLEKYGVEHNSQLKSHKEKVKQTNLLKFGVEYPLKSDQIKKKLKETCLERYGVDHHLKSKFIRDKIENTNQLKLGVKSPFHSEEIKEKIKITNQRKYGVDNPFQSEEIKEKIKKTNQRKYGVDNPFKIKEIQEKIRKNKVKYYYEKAKITLIKKYGENPFKNFIIREKTKKTCYLKYGVDVPTKCKLVQDKATENSLKKYGVCHHMQVPEIADKSSIKSYLFKNYKFPSGKIIKVQGYEPFALDELIQDEKIDENDIVTLKLKTPEIWYQIEENKKRRHFVDIFIPSQNKCIEVKSTWTFEKNREAVMAKQNAAKKLGFLYEIWIYNRNKEKINILI